MRTANLIGVCVSCMFLGALLCVVIQDAVRSFKAWREDRYDRQQYIRSVSKSARDRLHDVVQDAFRDMAEHAERRRR